MKNTKNVSGSREKLTFENKHKSLFCIEEKFKVLWMQ